eukprot:jgi/Chrzof1/1726/Cz10g18220.t1
MMSTARKPKAPQAVLDVLSQTEASSLFLVQRKGPTCFVVCEGEEGSDKHRVMLGARTTCSCRQPNIDSQSASAMPCVHIMFIMTKVLRIPSDDPLAWKLTLTDRELEQVLSHSRQVPVSSSKAAVKGEDKQGSSTGATAQRRPVEEMEPCPICYEDMSTCSVEWLVWCQQGCGHNVHGKCMR